MASREDIELIKAEYQKRYYAVGLVLPSAVDSLVWQWLANRRAQGYALPLQLPRVESLRLVPFFQQSLHEEKLGEPRENMANWVLTDLDNAVNNTDWDNWTEDPAADLTQVHVGRQGVPLMNVIDGQAYDLVDEHGDVNAERAYRHFFEEIIGPKLPTPEGGKFASCTFPDIKEVVACLKANDTAFRFVPEDDAAPELAGELQLETFSGSYESYGEPGVMPQVELRSYAD